MPKKSITPFTYYTFRYDFPNEDMIDKVMNCIKRLFPKYAIFREISDEVEKPHLQGKIGVALSLIQARKNLQADMPGVFVKTNYSLKEITKPEGYDGYIAKHGNVVGCNIDTFTPEFIQEQVDKHKQLKTAFESKKQKKESTTTFTQKVMADFILKFPIETDHIRSPFYKPNDYEKKVYDNACRTLLKFILKRLGDVVKVFDDNVLQRMYTGIKNGILQADEKCCEEVVNMYENRIQL